MEFFMSQATFTATLDRSRELEADVRRNPGAYRILTGDRPTGPLHVGHFFGTLQNRVALQDLGITTYIVIADYQVLTDREACEGIAGNVRELTLDYLAAGLDPASGRTFIFPHSHVPELNQLLLPFLTLVTRAELDRNPTVKEEIQASGQGSVNAGMYTYPVHQAADILFCKANLVPVGKDQLPHLEMTRTIARCFNSRYGEVFPEAQALLSRAPEVTGLDGAGKMSKSRGNSIPLGATEDETAALIRAARTDAERVITYDPEGRPGVAGLLRLAALATGDAPEAIAERLGDQGAGALKRLATEALNAHLRPLRERRRALAREHGYLREVLEAGIRQARALGAETLAEVRGAMNMAL
jgi:tryptophanyl-tRNA synthetase